MSWYLEALKRSFEFGGRSRRREYWSFTMINGLIGAIFVLAALGIDDTNVASGFAVLYLVYMIGTTIPSMSVTFRRLHDTDRSA